MRLIVDSLSNTLYAGPIEWLMLADIRIDDSFNTSMLVPWSGLFIIIIGWSPIYVLQ